MTAPDGRVYPLANGNAALGTVPELLETQTQLPPPITVPVDVAR